MRRLLLGAALAAVLAGGSARPAAAQCAMCKTALTGSAEGQRISSGMNRGIVVMLTAPYLVFGSFAAVLFRDQLRQRAARWLGRRRRGDAPASAV